LEKLSKWQRVAAVRQCFKDDGVCPYGADFVVESARSPAESKQLKSLAAGLEKAERRRNAPLRCCDGTDSPSCTCGRPRRGCCSRHGGVCGCSD
ncbi:MAG: hypothetical protein KC492_20050, partial [Myxococcales bacterium]|nr:hypothetical protein [Myxococcales bacterium]